MKKILSLFTLFIAALTLIGCETTPEDPDPKTHSLTLESDYSEANLSQDPEGPHEEGDEVEVSADWDDDQYEFIAWETDGETVSEESTFTHTVEGDETLEAVFEEKEPET
ncbi:MAG: InlB B-repeat-containing protein, partial [Bacillota bacterium]